MNVKKFSAQTSREALRMVRDELGTDAVILSNRAVEGGIEILALANADMASLPDSPAANEILPAPLVAALSAQRSAQARAQNRLQHPASPSAGADQIRPVVVERASRLAAPIVPRPAEPTPAPVASFEAVSNVQAEMREMMGEIRSMRGMLESQLAEISWGAQNRREPMKATLMREMLSAGFSASLSRYLAEKLPETEGTDPIAWMKAILMRNLSSVEDENAIFDEGGVFALVGPTGVGKTTTTAKLAARCVMRHGAGKLALITTDGYRIGGFEQLRIYGKILGVMVHSVKDEGDLRIALSEMKNKHTVLIDTAGAGQRDQMVAEQIAMLSAADTPVKRILCLSATSTGETLTEVVRAYKGDGLAGAIITKLDEAATTGSVLDVLIRQKLPVHYIANGQRVPEDLHLARPELLIDRAFKMKREGVPFQYQDGELPLVIGSTAHLMNDPSLKELEIG